MYVCPVCGTISEETIFDEIDSMMFSDDYEDGDIRYLSDGFFYGRHGDLVCSETCNKIIEKIMDDETSNDTFEFSHIDEDYVFYKQIKKCKFCKSEIISEYVCSYGKHFCNDVCLKKYIISI